MKKKILAQNKSYCRWRHYFLYMKTLWHTSQTEVSPLQNNAQGASKVDTVLFFKSIIYWDILQNVTGIEEDVKRLKQQRVHSCTFSFVMSSTWRPFILLDGKAPVKQLYKMSDRFLVSFLKQRETLDHIVAVPVNTFPRPLQTVHSARDLTPSRFQDSSISSSLLDWSPRLWETFQRLSYLQRALNLSPNSDTKRK